MQTLYERLIEICRDQGIENPRPKDISEVCGISSGRPKQIKDAMEAAKLGAESLARLVAKGYSPEWIQEGKGAKFISQRREVPIEEIETDQLVSELARRLVGEPDIEMRNVLVSIELQVSRAMEKKRGNGGGQR